MKMKHLPEIIVGIGILVALLTIGIGFWLSNGRNPFGPPPRIEMQLGDDWAAIQQKSAYPFRNLEKYRTGFSTEYEPVAFVYTDPAHRLAFPETYGIYFQFTDDRVTEIRVMQYGNAAEWAQTEQAVRALVARVEGAGWQPTHSRGTLDEVLAARLGYYQDHKNFMNDQFLDSWTADGARLDLSLYRTRNEGDVVNGQPVSAAVYTIYVTFKRRA